MASLLPLCGMQAAPWMTLPIGWKESIQGKLTDAQWKELTTPGSPLNKRWEVPG